jgi:hypothetical protein
VSGEVNGIGYSKVSELGDVCSWDEVQESLQNERLVHAAGGVECEPYLMFKADVHGIW